MTTSAVENRISDLWNRAVDLGRRGRLKDMLDAWLEVRQLDSQHRVLDDRERARMHLFLGNAHLANRDFQNASDEYAQAATLFQQRGVDEGSVQWIEETFLKWEAARAQAREQAASIACDKALFESFREIVPSFQASQRVKEEYKVSVSAMYGHWVICFERGGVSWEFTGISFEAAIRKAKAGARGDLVAAAWGPRANPFPPFPG